MLIDFAATAWWPALRQLYRERPVAGSGRDAIRV
jgi:hypothetical protein